MTFRPYAFLMLLALGATPPPKNALPSGFVYLSDFAPTVIEDMRYATPHNFVGAPIAGYDAPKCVLTAAAARALARVEHDLNDAGLTLRVYDCYRPQRAVDAMLAWSKNLGDQRTKIAYYPRIDKSQLGHLGYVAARSEHSRGSAVDATIERLPVRALPPYDPSAPLHECIAPFKERYHDGSLDMGTTFDCFDPLSAMDADAGIVAASHRQALEAVMHRHGFVGIVGEWWHYRLRWEPYPTTYFNFPITPKP
ncbi:MAG: M15 family metallopeptidase [Candidatus Eremiobacteraeota bacterium]|nr:M15 family metallopeptidase [Candidatus Eremiobacteraeota bacterium]